MGTILIYSAFVFAAAFAGGFLALSHERHPLRLGVFVSFAAGFILSTALLFLVPEAVEQGKAVWVLAGFIFIYLGEHLVMMHGCHDEDCAVHRMGMAAFIGLSLHTLASGISIGASLRESAALGLVTFLAVVLHKGPEAFSLGSILIHSGTPRRRILVLLGLYALIVPVSATASYFLLKDQPHDWIAVVIGFSAGTFLEVGGSDLLPQVHHIGPGRKRRFAGFLAGVLVAALAGFLAHGAH